MKKVISILLSSLIVLSSLSFSAFATGYKLIPASEALKQYEEETGEKVETNRYYFLMPNGENGDLSDNEYNTFTSESNYAKSWYNEYTDTAGIYWWDSGVYDPAEWAGYLMDKADADSVFYADIPEAVTTIIFNNAIDGGMDKEDPLYYLAQQTINVPCEYYDAGESDNYPNGTESFDNMIFVVDPDLIPVSDLSLKSTYGGEWYYYYGDGCYGFEKNGNSTNCLRDDHNHDADETLGDVDGDSVVSILDATAIQRDIAKLQALTIDEKAKADLDGDGEVTVLDATAIQMIIAKLD